MHAWSKSDLTLFAWSFGLMALLMCAYSLNHFFRGEVVEGLAMASVMLIPLMIAIGFARMKRNRIWEQAGGVASAQKPAFDRATWEESFLNPDSDLNQDRIKNPPTIG
jgi:hypothetical protein